MYYLNANGGLTAADLLKALVNDAEIRKIANSELFKAEFIEKILVPEGSEEANPLGLDEMVLEQV